MRQSGGYILSSSQQSPGSAISKVKNIGGQTLRPLTIKNIIDSVQQQSDSAYRFCEYELHQVSIVGFIREVKSSSTVVNYTIEDGTGVINVKQYVQKNAPEGSNDGSMGGASSSTEPLYPEKTVVKVFGVIKSFENSRYIMAHRVIALEDYEDFVSHFISVLFTHVQTQNSIKAANDGNFGMDHKSAFGAGNNQNHTFNHEMSMSSEVKHLPPVQQSVFTFTMGFSHPEGPLPHEVVNALRNQYAEDEIKDAIAYLLNEGQLFHSNGDRFKCCL